MTTDCTRSALAWHVHGSWTESFVSGRHRYMIPVNTAKDADGRGVCGRDWPRAQEVPLDQLRADALQGFVTDRPAATVAGKAAREFALAHFGLDRFLNEWDRVIAGSCR